MNGSQQPSQNTMLEKLGVACGFVIGFLYTLPIYDVTYPTFYRLALYRAPHDYLWLWDGLYVVSLFFLIVTLVAFALSMVMGVIKGFFITLVVLLSKFGR